MCYVLFVYVTHDTMGTLAGDSVEVKENMNFELVFKELLKKFSDQNVRFALIGGFALHVAGFTRATKDIDFLIEAKDLGKVKGIMTQLGYELTHESPEFSNYWHPMGPLDCVDYLHAHREYTRTMLARAKKHKILENFEVPVLIPEDIIREYFHLFARDSELDDLLKRGKDAQ